MLTDKQLYILDPSFFTELLQLYFYNDLDKQL